MARLSQIALPAMLLLAAVAGSAAMEVRAQDLAGTSLQNEALLGGRNFPAGTLRGKFKVIAWPEIEIDGQGERMAPGGRIQSAQRMLVAPASITGQKLLVNYRRDAAGLVREVWVLSEDEARADRDSADRPFFNFWPFVANRGPRDDGKTPYDQLPKYGQ